MRLCIAFCSITLLSVKLAAVCSQPQPRLVCAEYFQSAVVVEARLVHSNYVSAPNETTDGHIYKMQTATILRGNVGPSFQVWEENSSGRAAFDWVVGHSYLLFLYSKQDRGWVLDGCGNSGPLTHAAAALKQIQEIASRRGGMIQVAVGGSWISSSPPMGEITVRAQSPQGTYTATTNDEGIAEIKVPAGRYSVTVPSQKVQPFDLTYDDPAKILIENGSCTQVQFVESAKKE